MGDTSLDQLLCPKCGQSNGCQSQNAGEFSCWCQQGKISDEQRILIASYGFSAQCLCQSCLNLLLNKKTDQ